MKQNHRLDPICTCSFDVDVTSSPAARMEVDSVHVVKRIVALLVDSFQPSGLSGAEQVCVCVCV